MQVIAIITGAFLAAAPVVRAHGSAVIHNKCDYDVYLWSVSADGSPDSPTILSSGGDPFVQSYETPSVGGMSLKLTNTSTMDYVSQFEYTLADNIYYDMSNVDCDPETCPFQYEGFFIKSASGCPTITCPSSSNVCDQAYNNPDDVMTCACDTSADVTLYLCATSDDGDDSSPSSVAPSSTTKATTYASTTSAPTTTIDSSSQQQPQTTSTPVTSDAGAATTTLVTLTRSWGWGGAHTQVPRAQPRHVHHPHARL